MTKNIFEDWFLNHLCCFIERYEAFLCLDNYSTHSVNLNDLQDHVKFIFFPPRTTSVNQPLEQDVMCVVKAKYLELTFAKLHRAVAYESQLTAV